jgi:chemosensory pili system protein ChpC
MADTEIRTIVAPLMTGNLLLPNVTVAELMGFVVPEPLKEGPDWVLGELVWHGWQVPVISLEPLLVEGHGNSVSSKARILIIKTLGESSQVNYLGIIIQGLPRLRKVTADNLVEQEKGDGSKLVFSRVSIDELDAIIPDIGELTRVVEEAAYGS